MRKALILAGALAAIATPALAVDPAKVAVMVAQMRADEQTASHRTWTAPELLQRWMVLNEGCRGGSGDDPATMRACDERNLVDAALFAHGYCFVGVGSTSRWEKGPALRWTRRGEEVVCHS